MATVLDSSSSDWDSLIGHSQMARHMRTIDWSSTPLGPYREWSPCLRWSVSVCLNSSFPMAVHWGPEFIYLYNDAYAAVIGDRHPRAFGRPAREVWPNSNWEETERPLLERCVALGESTREEDLCTFFDRHGYIEESYFDFSMDPIRAESGAIGGVFEVCIETTYRVIAERRTRVLHELAERTASARSADEVCALAAKALSQALTDVPFALLYLVDANGRTARLSAMTGIETGTSAIPPVVSLTESEESGSTHALGAVVRTRRSTVISDLTDRFPELKCGVFPEPVREALVLPIHALGRETLAGFLVAGISPRRTLDEGYRSFFELAAEHLGTAIANVTAIAIRAEVERAAGREEALRVESRRKDDFLAVLSHELRTPLTPLKLQLQLLEDSLEQRTPLDKAAVRCQLHHLVSRSARQVDRLSQLVEDVLEFLKLTTAPVALHCEEFDLSDLARTVLGRDSSGAVGPIELHAEKVVRGRWDRRRIEHVFVNLLSNATKYGEGKPITVTVDETGFDERHHAVLSVQDHGMGIAAQD
ncbi:MAG TPA: histidine kinase dimerization/phospho-acceptor domain-containing protein, partial [Labilithrix sp.]|nr:histidine kinase dimerization/phospho-acceptor domain-containing protein [Labilithrix sp.]